MMYSTKTKVIFNKILLIALSLIMCFSFVACNKDNQQIVGKWVCQVGGFRNCYNFKDDGTYEWWMESADDSFYVENKNEISVGTYEYDSSSKKLMTNMNEESEVYTADIYHNNGTPILSLSNDDFKDLRFTKQN